MCHVEHESRRAQPADRAQHRRGGSTTCLYTSTADSGFAIGAHPGDAGLLVVSPCSGHGFKHSADIGEAVAQLALTGQSAIDLQPFGLDWHDVVR